MPSHRRSRITRSLSAGIVVAALAAPAAPASPIVEQGSGKTDSGSIPTPPEQAPAEARAATTVVDEGFDLGSAAIGAGGTAALILLSLGGAAHVAGTRTRVHGA